MTAYSFFMVVIVVGLVIFGFGVMIGRKRREVFAPQEAFSLRMGLELSLLAVIFALLPFPLYFVSGADPAVYGMASLLLAAYFLSQTVRVGLKLIAFDARWPATIGLLLVLSVIFSTIEVLNAFIVRGLAWYAWGLLWLLLVAGLQVVAFLFHDRRLSYDTLSVDIPPVYEHHNAVAERLRRNGGSGGANGTAYGYQHTHVDPVTHARLERYHDRYGVSRARDTDWRPFSNAAVRPDTRRRT